MGRVGTLDERVYRCLYCKQRCATVGILKAHERDCPRRVKKEEEWRRERKRHSNRLASMKDWKRYGD